MKKILLSVLTIAFVGFTAFGISRAYFSDVETSTGNIIQAGELDLLVDSTSHYAGMVCTLTDEPDIYTWVDEDQNLENNTRPELLDTTCDGTWAPTDLGAQKFFNLTDIKPGDEGEDTISLHVDNDAWLRLVIDNIQNLDNSCTEPENEAEPGDGCTGEGELQQNLLFSMWLDQGVTPGFQGPQDLSECDNDRPAEIADSEPMIITEGPINSPSETWDLSLNPGSYKYLIGGQTACFGVAWRLPGETGNDVQSDSMIADIEFQVQQHRNNPTPNWGP